jgi:hypothetical protein
MEETIRVSDFYVELSGVAGVKASGIYTGREYDVVKYGDGCRIPVPYLDEYEVIVIEEDR